VVKTRACLTCGLLLVLLLPLAGCQRLNFEKTYTVEPTAFQQIELSPPRYQQKLTVEVKSPDSPVSVYVIKLADKDRAEQALYKDKAPEGALASKEKSENVTVETTIPAGTEVAVLIKNVGKKSSQVSVKITGR
jgi:predicted component of type VI protein secretion system